MTNRVHRSRKSRAQSLVEFALILPVVAMLFLGAVDLTRAFYYYIVLENATREGARVLIDYPYQFDDSAACAAVVREAQSYVTLSCSGASPTITISPAVDLTANPPHRVPGRKPVTVTATMTFSPITIMLQQLIGSPITIRASTTMTTWY
ncbi:MAG: TadE family protein [Candidatus Dormibacter sp.]